MKITIFERRLYHQQKNCLNHMRRQESAKFAKNYTKTLNMLNILTIKIYEKLGTIDIIQVNTEVLHIAYVILDIVYQKKFLQFSQKSFHNRSNYDYYFIIKELAVEFKGEFRCPGENAKKIQSIFSSNKKEVKN